MKKMDLFHSIAYSQQKIFDVKKIGDLGLTYKNSLRFRF